MEKLFLGTGLAGDELDVIDQKHIHVSEAVSEQIHFLEPQMVDHFIHELLGGTVTDILVRLGAAYGMSDRIEQMTLAKANATVYEERIIGIGRIVCHRHG